MEDQSASKAPRLKTFIWFDIHNEALIKDNIIKMNIPINESYIVMLQ